MGMINHWLLVTTSIFSPSPLSVVDFPGNQLPSLGAFPSHSININPLVGKGFVENNKTPISPLWF